MRGAAIAGLVLVVGCTEPLVDDIFTDDEWAYAQTFRADTLPSLACTDCTAALAGKQLFFDKRLSKPGTVACATCHDPTQYFADVRPGNTSFGLKWTKRNTLGLVNVGYLTTLSWNGDYTNLVDVLDLPVTAPAALGSTRDDVATLVHDHYGDLTSVYGPIVTGVDLNAEYYRRAGRAIEAYEQQLVSGPSPFDRYLAGERDAIDDTAKRGFQIFIGRGLCSECHDGPLFTDQRFYNTSVPQTGANVPIVDDGFKDGRFRTPPLRNVAMTAPYMHTGDQATLADVIDFYRWGGHPDAGKDGRILPLEIDDDDAHALEAFLLSLTGTPVPERWTTRPPTAPALSL